jgi:prepilin-type N-terminal cleavage/methylation domain-containing protein
MFDQLVRARHHRRFAFTLIELIAVVVVLSVLSALEVPTFERVRTETRASVAERVLDGIANDAIALSGFDTGQMTFATIDTALSELNDGSGVSWNVVEQASQAAYAAARR